MGCFRRQHTTYFVWQNNLDSTLRLLLFLQSFPSHLTASIGRWSLLTCHDVIKVWDFGHIMPGHVLVFYYIIYNILSFGFGDLLQTTQALTFRKSDQINKHPYPYYLWLLGCSLVSKRGLFFSVLKLTELLHCFHADGRELPTARTQQSLTFLRTCDFPLCFPSLPPTSLTSQTRDHGAATPWKTALPGSEESWEHNSCAECFLITWAGLILLLIFLLQATTTTTTAIILLLLLLLLLFLYLLLQGCNPASKKDGTL